MAFLAYYFWESDVLPPGTRGEPWSLSRKLELSYCARRTSGSEMYSWTRYGTSSGSWGRR